MHRGRFITFEGVEGCGKSTQIQLLAEQMRSQGRECLVTREPGGTDIGEKIRAVLLDAAHHGMQPLTELLLYEAARFQHVRDVIQPALQAGKIVLCDRYADATTAYQGAARMLDPAVIEQLNAIGTDGLWPDQTILMDADPHLGLMRARDRNAQEDLTGRMDRFEQEALSFHTRVRQGYLSIARKHPKRIIVINAEGTIQEIHGRIRTALHDL